MAKRRKPCKQPQPRTRLPPRAATQQRAGYTEEETLAAGSDARELIAANPMLQAAVLTMMVSQQIHHLACASTAQFLEELGVINPELVGEILSASAQERSLEKLEPSAVRHLVKTVVEAYLDTVQLQVEQVRAAAPPPPATSPEAAQPPVEEES